MFRPPVIGFSLDYEEAGGYSKMPWYALRENYCGSVARFGAAPVALPHEPERVEAYLDILDGLVITGGAFDVSPALYGQSQQHETVVVKERRTRFEWEITKGALVRGLPVLGICGGQQLLNVVLGGTLIQHIPDSVKDALEHEQKNPRNEPGHSVAVTPGTLLHRILTSPSPVGEGSGWGHGSTQDSATHRYPLPVILSNARDLRKRLTDAESLLWQLLRGQQLGAKFRRQHPVGRYVTDFACLDHKLIIELAGGQHAEDEGLRKDAERSRYLENKGFNVLRFWNHDVLQQTEAVMEEIYRAIHRATCSHPSPPPNGEGVLMIEVNSAHHQAVDRPAPGSVVNAAAPDGVIEGQEWPEYRFCIGVQWHPEYFVTAADEKIMRAFVEACGG